MTHETGPAVAPVPQGLLAPGSASAPFRPAIAVDALPAGAMVRVTFGDLDLLLAHLPDGVVATDDRCPHMAAPLSIGSLAGTIVDCPLHSGRFDLANGGVVQMPTTGGLAADGTVHPTWTQPGSVPKPEPPGIKAQARRLTRVRLLRYYPVRVVEDMIEVAVPA